MLSIASDKKFGLGGNIITGLGRRDGYGPMGSFSRNSMTYSEMKTNQSELTAFGNCPFNVSNLSLSVYGNNSIIGGGVGLGGNGPGRGPYAMMHGLNHPSPKRQSKEPLDPY